MNFGKLNAEIFARFFARFRGLTVVIVAALASFVIFASYRLDVWEKIVGYSIIGLVALAASAKLLISGAEEPTTFRTSDMTMSNMPPWLALMLVFSESGLRDYFRRPLPRPAGIIDGSAVNRASVKETPDARLPMNVETTDEPLEMPSDAASPSLTPPTGSMTLSGESPKVN
jgi:hypothetical protein